VRIDVTQRIEVPRDRVVAALADPAWYAAAGSSPGLGEPEPLSLSSDDGVLRTSVRWRYVGTLPPLASRFVDADRLTWVIEVRCDLSTFSGTLHVVPDHYEGLLTCEAQLSFAEDGAATIERVIGDLSVKVPFVGEAVERGIANGFVEHVATEAAALEEFCAS
jgi:hypothetical protein